MQSVQNVTAEILSTAKKQATEIVERATLDRQAKLDALSASLTKATAEIEEKLARESEEIVRRRLTVAGLDVRMQACGEKQKVIAKAYVDGEKKFRALSDNEYRDYFEKLVLKYAKGGEKIEVAKSDSKRLDEAWLKGIIQKLGKPLTYEIGETDGGLTIISDISEIDLTVSTLLDEVKSKCDVASILFSKK